MGEKFGMKEVMDATFYDLENHRPVLFVDSLKISTLENMAEEVEARGGRGNPILLTWDYNREAEFTIQDALISFEGLSLMTGTPLQQLDDAVLYKRETLNVTDNEATLSEVPADPATGENSTDRLFVYDADKGIGAGELTVTIAEGSKDISGIEEGVDRIVAYYPYEHEQATEKIERVTITSEDFPGFYRIVGDTIVRNARTGRDEPFQLVVANAKVRPGFTLTMEAEGDPSVFDMNLRVIKPTDATRMITMTKYAEGS